MLLRSLSHKGPRFSWIVSRDISYLKSFKKVDGVNYLKKFIVDKIRTSGPITVAEYMKTCVSAPQVGYYGQFSEKQKVFGSAGDFITAPELTQLFGEMIGVWVYNELANTGHAGPWNLAELGPGRGQLMRDVLSVLSKFNDEKVTVHLVETSDALIEEQEKILCGRNSDKTKDSTPHVHHNKTGNGFDVFWYKSIDDIPDGFTVFVANEFLDALPVHQFRKIDEKWTEIYINLDRKEDLCFMQSRGENIHTNGLIPQFIRENESRSLWECSPDAGTVVNQVVDRITTFGGFSLFVDYGHNGSRTTHSFRAYKNHNQVDPLIDPGATDLTADVDFGYLSTLVRDQALVYGPVPQRFECNTSLERVSTLRDFLIQLGIEHRLRYLLRACRSRSEQENTVGQLKSSSCLILFSSQVFLMNQFKFY